MQGNDAREAPEVEPPQEDGRFPTVYGESEADIAARIVKVRYTELQAERELLEATPMDDLYTVPAQMITDSCVLVTVAKEQRGHQPTWGNPQDIVTPETYHVNCAPRAKTTVLYWTLAITGNL
eukprot:8688065-Pyramimonas_sp.AAC.1